jgi:hypothetical protein
MHRDEAPALRGTWLGALLKVLNRPMQILLTSPFHRLVSEWFLLLRWVGPQSGKVRAIPISYVAESGELYATTGDGWWRSVSHASEIEVTFRGQTQAATVRPIDNGERAVAQLEWLFNRHPFFRRFAGIPTIAGNRADTDSVRRSVSAGRTLLRISLDDE